MSLASWSLLVGMPFALALAACLLLKQWAPRLGLLDHPETERKHHLKATPVVGGLGIVFAAVVSIIVLSPHHIPVGLLIGAVVMVVLGVLDDKFDLSWKIRFPIQAVAMLPMIVLDGARVDTLGQAFGVADLALGPLSIPVTLITALGVINAVNMIDGVDGLAGAVVFCALAMITGLAGLTGQTTLALNLIPFLAAIAGFLMLNMRWPWSGRAKIFLGNGGAEFLGLLVAWATFKLTNNPHLVPPVTAPYYLAPAIFDCLALMMWRTVSGQSPFTAARDHLHHRMLRSGLSVTGVVVVFAGLTMLVGMIGILAKMAGIPGGILVVAYLAVLAVYIAMVRPKSAAELAAAAAALAEAQPTHAPITLRQDVRRSA